MPHRVASRNLPMEIVGRYIHQQGFNRIVREALLIFGGKASIYLQMLQKPLSQHWQEWIG